MKQKTQMQSDELPEGWEWKKIKEICKVVGGSTPKTGIKEYWNGNILWITPADLTGFISVYITNTARKITKEGYDSCPTTLLPKGAVLMSTRAPIGYLVINGKEMCTNQGFKSFICSKLINNKFLYYYLKSIVFLLKQSGSGTTFDEISKTRAENIEIPIPFPSNPEKSLKIQQQIVDKLDTFFEHYNRLKEQKQIAKDNYGNILQSAINRFLLKRDYEKKKLSDICIINPQKSEIKNLNEDIEVSFVPMSNVDEIEGSIKILETRKLKDVKKGYTYFKENDVLFAKITPCMENGKVAILKNLKNNVGFGSTEFHVIRPNEKILADYIFYFLRQPLFRQEAKMKMTGTAGQLRVPSDFLANYEIPLPPIKEQKEIVISLNKIKENYKFILQQQSLIDKKIEQLPKSVLSKAFKGEL